MTQQEIESRIVDLEVKVGLLQKQASAVGAVTAWLSNNPKVSSVLVGLVMAVLGAATMYFTVPQKTVEVPGPKETIIREVPFSPGVVKPKEDK